MASPHLRGPTVETGDGDSMVTVSDIASFLRRWRFLILVFFLGGSFLAAFYAASADPVFTARTQILIEPRLPQYTQQQEVATSLDAAQVETQIAVMRSEKIGEMVIDELDLMQNPDFFRIEGISFADRVDRFLATLFRAVGLDAADRPDFFRRLAESGSGEAIELTDFERDRYAIALFQGALEIRRVGVSYAIDIYVRSRNPELAAQIANATAEMFIREQTETKAAAAMAGGEWLERRLEEMRDRMNRATQVAQEFRARHDYRVQRPSPEFTQDERDEGTTLEELEVTADTYRQMYESFLIAYTNNVSSQSYPGADARIITPATTPLSASHPRKKLILAFGMVSGLAVGAGIGFLRHLLDRTLRSPRQISEELGLRCLAELPAQPGWNDGLGSFDAVVATPFTWFSESLRRAKAALGNGSGPLRCIGVTSAVPHEGKDVVACNLALLYARAGVRTVLVNADAGEQVLANMSPAGRGVAESTSRDPQMPGIVRQAFDDVDLLSAETSEWVRGTDLPDLTEYGMVVVNLPPLDSGADRLKIAGALDGTLVVTEWGRTPIELVRELLSSLQTHDAHVLGVLLTKVKSLSTTPYMRENHGWARMRAVSRFVPAQFRR